MTIKGLRRHLNADQVTGTKLLFPDHATQSGMCAVCTQCGQCEIGKKSKTGQTLFPQPFGTSQFGAEKRLPNIEDLQIIPELYGGEVFFDTIEAETTIGGFKVRAPISVAAMGSTIVAHSKGRELAIGAAKAGIPMAIGENVVATYGEQGLKERMQPYLDNYDGYGALVVQANKHDMKMGVFEKAVELGAHAIEVKIGQGAKQGLGGEIKFEGEEAAEKYKQLGYHVVRNPDGSFQRHASPGELSDELLKETLVKYSELGLPIWVKTGMGRGTLKLVEALERIKKEEKVKVECLTIDGFGGGTGMSPWLVMNEMSIPSAAVMQLIEKQTSFDILLAGGYNNGFDVGKAMMLGAKGVSMGRPFLITAATGKAEGVQNFVKAITTELKMLSATLKVNKVSEITGRKQNLIALSKEAGEMFGVPTNPKAVL